MDCHHIIFGLGDRWLLANAHVRRHAAAGGGIWTTDSKLVLPAITGPPSRTLPPSTRRHWASTDVHSMLRLAVDVPVPPLQQRMILLDNDDVLGNLTVEDVDNLLVLLGRRNRDRVRVLITVDDPSRLAPTLRQAVFTRPGLCAVSSFGVAAIPHVTVVARDEPDTLNGVERTCIARLAARHRNAGGIAWYTGSQPAQPVGQAMDFAIVVSSVPLSVRLVHAAIETRTKALHRQQHHRPWRSPVMLVVEVSADHTWTPEHDEVLNAIATSGHELDIALLFVTSQPAAMPPLVRSTVLGLPIPGLAAVPA